MFARWLLPALALCSASSLAGPQIETWHTDNGARVFFVEAVFDAFCNNTLVIIQVPYFTFIIQFLILFQI